MLCYLKTPNNYTW